MGAVYKATHPTLHRPVAIKLIRPEMLGTNLVAASSVLRRFEREAQATANLRSPNTVEIYDFGITDDGTFYYVMELLDGVDLVVVRELTGGLYYGRPRGVTGPPGAEVGVNTMSYTREEIERIYDDRFVRMWEYYLGCGIAAAFASDSALFQVLFTNDLAAEIPLCRV